MNSLTSNFEAISSLWELKEGVSESQKPVFETWPLGNYGQCVELDLEMRVPKGYTSPHPPPHMG